jgi:DNA polymerase I-like protein with 3'-5' exonuclease and polymerase domains
MLVVITTSQKLDCLRTLGSVLCNHQNLPMEFVQSIAEALRLINAGGVKAVFSLGSGPLEEIQAAGYVPKNRKVAGLRKQVMSLAGVPLMVSYSPNIGEVDYSQFVDLLTDTNLACVLASTGSISPKYGDYKYVPTLAPIVQGVKALLEDPEVKKVPLAFDTETLGLDRFHPEGYLISLQFSFKVGTAYMVAWSSRAESLAWLQDFQNQQDLHWLMNEPRIALRAANGKYDLEWLYEHSGITCTNFTADTTLIGSLLDENRSNGLDVHAKIYAPRLAGYCVSPETRIWKSDLTWVQADDVEVGDILVGFDEHPVQAGRRRKLRKSVVLSKQYLELPGRRITMKSGLVLNVSSNHAWLAKKPTAQGNLTWIPSDELIPGTRIKRIADVLGPRTDFDGGWFSGLLDGEGWTCQASGSNTFRVGFAQKNGLVLQKALKIAGSQVSVHSVTAGRDVVNVTSKGSFGGLSWLQLHRPVRLLSKEHWFGSPLPQEDELDYVVENIPLPLIKVVSLKTTTHTFVAEGLASHNSDDFDSKTDKSRMDLAYARDPQKFLNYSAGDADATLEVSINQIQQLTAVPHLARFYVNILHPAARAYEIVERGGVFIDMEEFNRLEADLIADLHSLTDKGKKIIGGSLVAKHFDADKTGGLNLTKASLITDFMFSPRGLNLKPKMLTEKTKAPVTSLEHLEMFKYVPEAKEFVGLMSEFSSTNKTLSTYINGFRQHIRSDGKFHPTFFLMANARDDDGGGSGTVTGRLSARDPAFQCCKGNVLVYNKEGWTSLQSIVEGYEQGYPFTVLTHTGEWKPVVGVYRNGLKPLLKITTKSGAVLECTGNHPWLTDYGFVQAEKLGIGSKVWRFYETAEGGEGVSNRAVDGDRGLGGRCQGSSQVHVPMRVWGSERTARIKSNWDEAEQVLWLLQAGQADNAWAQPQRERILDLLVLAAHEKQVSESTRQGLLGLWGQGNLGLRFVERFVRDLSSRYGGEAAESHVREIGRKWELLQGQLYMGHGLRTGSESQELGIPDVERGDQTPVRLGFQLGGETFLHSHEITSWVERDSSPYHAFQAHQAGFEQDTIVSIEAVPAEETYDLTIQDSHSFVANGVVVHNTIPKHTKWGKRIRRCYNAPPGMLVAEEDYSQGELKVMACIANEQVMIEAYQKGLDLHVVTSSFVAGLTYDEMMELKKTNKDQYDDIRQLGKAGNFGLIYGMGVEGFIDYARTSYGVIMSYEKAAEFHAGFFTRYPGLPNYHKQYKEFAHRKGYVVSPLGRVRHLPMINAKRSDIRSREERRAVNSPVQSTLSDMLLWAIALQYDLGWFDESPCFGSIHDASYFYIPEDNYEFYVKRSVEVMENLPFHKIGWEPQLKFTADAKVGPNMGQLTEIKFK